MITEAALPTSGELSKRTRSSSTSSSEKLTGEGRIPNSEVRIPKSGSAAGRVESGSGLRDPRVSGFVRISDFGIRTLEFASVPRTGDCWGRREWVLYHRVCALVLRCVCEKAGPVCPAFLFLQCKH